MNQNISIRNLAMGAFLALGLATISGCSTLEDVPENATGSVQVTLLGITEGGEEPLTKAQAEPQTVTVPVTDDWGMICTLTPDPVSKTRATTPMTTGVKYRMVVYDAGTSTEKGSQLVTAGSEASAPVIYGLNPGNYDFVFYSLNTTTDPGVPSGGNVTVAAGSDLLYAKVTGVAVVAGTVKQVTAALSHKFSGVRVVANSWAVGPNINSVSANLNNCSGATLSASDGALTQAAATSVPVVWSDAASNLRTSNTLGFYATGASTSYTLTFPVNSINIGGTSNTTIKTVSFTKTLVAGTRYTLTARFTRCSAKVSATVTKVFMCHNLGADYTADPFTASYKLNGAYWQYGKLNFSVGGPTNAAGSDPSYTWNTNNYDSSNATWLPDPCPTGYRLPTSSEIIGLVANNTRTSQGTWTSGTNNFAAAITFAGSVRFPASGFRDPSVGTNNSRGVVGYYWANDQWDLATGYILELSSGNYASGNGLARNYGLTIRCIEK